MNENLNYDHIKAFVVSVLLSAGLFGVAAIAPAQAEDVQDFGTSTVTGSIGMTFPADD